jgi:aspartate kinase
MVLEDRAGRTRSEAAAEPRPIIVQKYGGSSVADVDKLGRVADRVVAARRTGHDVVVVVSAMGKTTDGLLELARQVAGNAEPARRELDMLVSTGERVAMSLLSIAIQARGHDAISFTGSQCGIITNDRHFDARIIEVRPHRIEDELARGRIVIVAGYQGMSYRREITTLGRGGTDTTAVALAAALGAERCEIYSDVDGVYSADPRVVPDARHLPEVDYETLQNMAYAGAKVVCAQAVEWARRAGIAIYARSTFDPPSPSPPQTIVRVSAPGTQPLARAITADRKVALVETAGAASLAELLALLEQHELSTVEIAASETGTTVLLSLLNAPDWGKARAALRALPALRQLRDDIASVSVVGAAVGSDPATVATFRRTLGSIGATPLGMSVTALRLTALIEPRFVDDAQRALHAELVPR